MLFKAFIVTFTKRPNTPSPLPCYYLSPFKQSINSIVIKFYSWTGILWKIYQSSLLFIPNRAEEQGLSSPSSASHSSVEISSYVSHKITRIDFWCPCLFFIDKTRTGLSLSTGHINCLHNTAESEPGSTLFVVLRLLVVPCRDSVPLISVHRRSIKT